MSISRTLCVVSFVMSGLLGCNASMNGGKTHLDPREMELLGEFDPGSVSWSQMDVDTLLALFERSDRELEKKLFGGYDARIRWHAMEELKERIAKGGLQSLSEEQGARLIRQARWYLTHGHIDNELLVRFAGQVDCDFTASELLVNPRTMHMMPKTAMTVLAKAGKEAEVRRMLAKDLDSSDEVRVREALATIGEARITCMVDDVLARTKALRWLIRLQALHTLDSLDDPRTTEALASALADIRRHSIGFRILGFASALDALSSSEYLRAQLMDALLRRNVPGAKETFKAVLLDRGEAFLRADAGEKFFRLDPKGGVEIIRDLLSSLCEQDVLVGIEMADSASLSLRVDSPNAEASRLIGGLLPEIQHLAETSNSKEIRDAAKQAVRQITELGQRSGNPGPTGRKKGEAF